MDLTVSIIIPVYNVAPYVEACLKSVMRQAWQLKCYDVGRWLAVSYVLGRFKGGDKVYEKLWKNIIHK